MSRRLLSAGLALGASVLLIRAADAQSSPRPTFEVASVKPNPNCRQVPNAGPSHGRLDLPCITLRMLIRAAYGGFIGERLRARPLEAVGGPGWLDTEWFAVVAKAEGDPSTAEMMGPMLQVLLEERFQLKVRMESKETPVYGLTVVKPGKLSPMKQGSCVPIDWSNLPKSDSSASPRKYCGAATMKMAHGLSVLDVPGVTMEELTGWVLGSFIDRPMVDRTGITGRFDVHLEFAREFPRAAQLNGMPAPDLANAPPDGASIFTALQEQLGLKLAPEKARIDVIVVDSAAKPSEN